MTPRTRRPACSWDRGRATGRSRRRPSPWPGRARRTGRRSAGWRRAPEAGPAGWWDRVVRGRTCRIAGLRERWRGPTRWPRGSRRRARMPPGQRRDSGSRPRRGSHVGGWFRVRTLPGVSARPGVDWRSIDYLSVTTGHRVGEAGSGSRPLSVLTGASSSVCAEQEARRWTVRRQLTSRRRRSPRCSPRWLDRASRPRGASSCCVRCPLPGTARGRRHS